MVVAHRSSSSNPKKITLKDRRRKQIIKAVDRIGMNEDFQGFANVKMDDIALEAGLTKPTLYRYFKDKDDLEYAYAAHGYHLVSDLIAVKLTNITQGSIVNALQTLSTSYYKFTKERPAIISVLNKLGQKNAYVVLSDRYKKNPSEITKSENEYINEHTRFRAIIDENVSSLNYDNVQANYPNLERKDFSEIITIVINGIITEFKQRSQTLQRKGITEKFVLELVMALIGKGME